MKVIVDNKIPFIKEAIGKIADEVIYVPGKDFTPALVKDADALIIRTRTQCNRELLQGSRVQFIATATIGFDHIDTEYCTGMQLRFRSTVPAIHTLINKSPERKKLIRNDHWHCRSRQRRHQSG